LRIKLDHSEQDPDQSTASFEQPKPGIYRVRVEEATVRFNNKKLRDIEVVAKVVAPKYEGARLWDYPSFSKAAMWKMDQFMIAMGLMSRKKRRQEIKSEKELERKLKGTYAMVRVRGDSYEGEYKAKIAQWMPDDEEYSGDDEDDDDIIDDEELEDLEDEEDLEEEVDDDDEEEEEDDDEDEDEDDEGDEGDEEYSASDIRAMKIKELRAVADDLGLDHEGVKKPDLRDLILEELGLEDEDDEDDDEDEVPF